MISFLSTGAAAGVGRSGECGGVVLPAWGAVACVTEDCGVADGKLNVG
jgi:hypothetical protein